MDIIYLICICSIKAVACNILGPNVQNIANLNGMPNGPPFNNGPGINMAPSSSGPINVNAVALNNAGIPSGNMFVNNVATGGDGPGNFDQNLAGTIQGNFAAESDMFAASNLAKVDNILIGNLGANNLPGNFPVVNANMRNILANNVASNFNNLNTNSPNKMFSNTNLLNNMASTNLAQNMAYQKFPNNMANPLLSKFGSSMTKMSNSPTDIAGIVNMATNFGNPFANVRLENPYGMQVQSEALEIAGTVAVNGKLPIIGTVALQGNFPSNGVGTVKYECF
ncbi:hypothetical protein K1T71_014166 [Dendrolimus kikuchii]|uniref:Uncharacterized protein n=1 Tax=Dendrolimus kikuchii TaxID=765133 RepID=A0ACC1CF79_9NEOP|nr:hypothetical protein K1T71_014166 [Dendrolimus kikuchii]